MQREAIEQQIVINYCQFKGYPIFAIPNGGKRNAKEAYFLKLSGVVAGVPDLCVPRARRGYHGLYIEMKAGTNKPTEAQEWWIDDLNDAGYCARVCRGFEQAKMVLDWYFGGG